MGDLEGVGTGNNESVAWTRRLFRFDERSVLADSPGAQPSSPISHSQFSHSGPRLPLLTAEAGRIERIAACEWECVAAANAARKADQVQLLEIDDTRISEKILSLHDGFELLARAGA